MSAQIYIHRQQLNEKFADFSRFPLTVVHAPTGFGKTTAVNEFFKESNIPVLYLPLFGSNGSEAFLWTRLTKMISRSNPELCKELNQVGYPHESRQVAELLNLLDGYVFKEPKILILDDYQLIDDEWMSSVMSMIAMSRIPNLHIVLVGNDIRYLHVAELERKGVCLCLDRFDLEFNLDETNDYLKLSGIDLPFANVKEIWDTTGGWILWIHLILKEYQAGTLFTSRKVDDSYGGEIYRLLESNLNRLYSAESRDALEKLSFVSLFPFGMAEYIIGDERITRELRDAIRNDAFISYSNEQKTYAMTELLGTFLRDKAKEKGINPKPIYRKAAEWYLMHDNRLLAYSYYYQAEDTEKILQILNDSRNIDVQFEQFPQIIQIFSQIDSSYYYKYPFAALQYLRAKGITCDLRVRSELEDHLVKMEMYFRDEGNDAHHRNRVLGEIHNTWICLSFNDSRKMIEHAKQASGYFKGKYSVLMSNQTEFTFGTINYLATLHRTPGKLKETVDYFCNNRHYFSDAIEGCGVGSDHLVMAEYLLLTGRFSEVEEHARHAISESRTYHQVSIEMCATYVLSVLAFLNGDNKGAEQYLLQLSILSQKENLKSLSITYEVMRCILSVNMNVMYVSDWLRNPDLGAESFGYHGWGYQFIAAGFLARDEGRYQELLSMCRDYRKNVEKLDIQVCLIYLYLLESSSLMNRYSTEAALSSLRLALNIACPDGIVLPFLLFEELTPLYTHPEIVKAYPAEYLECLEEIAKRTNNKNRHAQENESLLTERELEILQGLLLGKSHKEIAQSLYISIPTVRFHVHNLYQKLGVNNKVKAISKAIELRLIEQ